MVSLSAFLPPVGAMMSEMSALSLISSLASGMRAVEFDSRASVSMLARMEPRKLGMMSGATISAYFLESRFLMTQMMTGGRSSRVSSHWAKRCPTWALRPASQR